MTEQFYKGLDVNWCDCYTGKTKYRKGKTVRIAIQRQNPRLCSSDVLHACRELHQCFKFINPRQICIVQGIPVVEDTDKVGFYEYKIARHLPHSEVGELLNMTFDLRPITHFFKRKRKVRKKDIQLLREYISVWASVRASVRASVWASVWASVRASVWASVKDSVWDSVWDSVRASVKDSVKDSVWDSVRASVKDSVWDSVRDSVWDSVYSYIGSLFPLKKWKYIEHKKGDYPFASSMKLIKRGLMPVFDGTTWHLLSGPKFKIVYSLMKEAQ